MIIRYEPRYAPDTRTRHDSADKRVRHDSTDKRTSMEKKRVRTVKRDKHDIEFIGVDGEGQQGKCRECGCQGYESSDPEYRDDAAPCTCGHSKYEDHPHEYVLLGVGQEYRQWPDGVKNVGEIFEFLYSQYEANPTACFVGFFLRYDFNMWLRLLPRERAAMLLTEAGRKSRERRNSGENRTPFPVEYGRWQFDMLGMKRFKLRPKVCDCPTTMCRLHGQDKIPWMYINDAGSYFATSLLNALNPDDWQEPIVTSDEYAVLEAGKGARSHARLSPAMIRYNQLENEALSRLMSTVNLGLVSAKIRLNRNEWFGPGQASGKWLKMHDALTVCRDHVRSLPKAPDFKFRSITTAPQKGETKDYTQIPGKSAFMLTEERRAALAVNSEFERSGNKLWEYLPVPLANDVRMGRGILDAIIASYYGGWFELMAHGTIPVGYEYDLNSAYPYVISRLPCICPAGTVITGKGAPETTLDHSWLTDRTNHNSKPVIRLCHVWMLGDSDYIGPMPVRLHDGRIYRPHKAYGWYWQHEIDMAIAAGLVKPENIKYQEWIEFQPCEHDSPVADIADLYNMRLEIGKDTVFGKSYKLVYNSGYGKFSQSTGAAPYANPLFASLVTSGCRSLILEAISAHPLKARGVVMVATDGVTFVAPHPEIEAEIAMQPLNKKGEHEDTRLGHWGRKEMTNLALFKPGVYWDDKGRKNLKFKARGINAREFAKQLETLDARFKSWTENSHPGMVVGFPSPEDEYQFREELEFPWIKYTGGFLQISINQALQWTEGEPENIGKYKALAGKVFSGKELKQDSDPKDKRNRVLSYDSEFGIWRTKPWTHREFPESYPYEKQFGIDEQNEWHEYATQDYDDPIMEFKQLIGRE